MKAPTGTQGAVQILGLATLGIRHPQETSQQLLDVHRALDPRDGTERIGEGTIPALLQRLDGDDGLDRALRIEQVDAVQLALIAGRHGDLLLGDLLDLHQVLLQHLDRHLLVLRCAWNRTMGRI